MNYNILNDLYNRIRSKVSSYNKLDIYSVYQKYICQNEDRNSFLNEESIKTHIKKRIDDLTLWNSYLELNKNIKNNNEIQAIELEKLNKLNSCIRNGNEIIITDWKPLFIRFYYEYKLNCDQIACDCYKLLDSIIYNFNNIRLIIEETKFDLILELFIDLSVVSSQKNLDLLLVDLNKTIEAIDFFKLKNNDYAINFYGIVLHQETLKKIHSSLESDIIVFGVKCFIERLLEQLKKNCFNSKTGRYDFVSYKAECRHNNTIPIPYKYLLNLSYKNLTSNIELVSNSTYKVSYNYIIEKSKKFFSMLECYRSNMFDDICLGNIEYLPKFVQEHINYETMCCLEQYYPDFILELIYSLLIPYFNNSVLALPNIYRNKFFKNIIKDILNNKDNSEIDINSLLHKYKLSDREIIEFLDYFSIEAVRVNNVFVQPFERTNLFDFPLIKTNVDTYYMVSPIFAGFAFYKIIYETIRKSIKNIRDFDNNFGHEIEKLVYKKLSSKGISYKNGFYEDLKGNRQECDLILQNNKNLIFIEIKKKSLPVELEMSDDSVVWNEFGNNGLLKAQYQIMKQVIILEKNKKVDYYKTNRKKDITPIYTLELNNKKILKLSISLYEYLFFTEGLIAQKMFRILGYGEIHSVDSDDTKLNRLLELREDVDKHLNNIDSSMKEDLFKNINFLSLQQLFYAIFKSNNEDDFINLLIKSSCIITMNCDFYSKLDYLNSLQKINHE